KAGVAGGGRPSGRAAGRLARVGAERQGWRAEPCHGLRQAAEGVVTGDCAPWIDTARDEHIARYPRVPDDDHAAEHVWDAARAARGRDGRDAPQSPAAAAVAAVAAPAGESAGPLYGGRADEVIRRLSAEAAAPGPIRGSDGDQHPRRPLARGIGSFERNQGHMDFPAYISKVWPIGSGNTRPRGPRQPNPVLAGRPR